MNTTSIQIQLDKIFAPAPETGEILTQQVDCRKFVMVHVCAAGENVENCLKYIPGPSGNCFYQGEELLSSKLCFCD